MKTIIAGGRNHIVQRADYQLLDIWKRKLPITEVVSGGATGADRLGEIWAETRGVPVCRKEPDALGGVIPFWQAARHRNQAMADYADALIAFPGGTGTADMIQRATQQKLVVIIVKDAQESLHELMSIT